MGIHIPPVATVGLLILSIQLNILNIWMCGSTRGSGAPMTEQQARLLLEAGGVGGAGAGAGTGAGAGGEGRTVERILAEGNGQLVLADSLYQPGVHPKGKIRCDYFPETEQCAPEFIIIGTTKGGTTTLFKYLETHPQIEVPDEKELRFFDFKIRYPKKYGGLQSYVEAFPKLTREKGHVTFEATPWYFFMPLTAQRMYEVLPNVKLVSLLRDPADRAWSHYHFDHLIKQGINATFEEVVDMEIEKLSACRDKAETYGFGEFVYYCYLYQYPKKGKFARLGRMSHWHALVANGMYVEQLRHWTRYYPRNQILLIKSEDMFFDTEKTMRELLDFVGLKQRDYSELAKRGALNVRKNVYDDMPSRIRQKMIEWYKPYNDKLSVYWGKDLSDWNTVDRSA